MKNIIFVLVTLLLFSSCNDDDSSRIEKFRVNHYRDTASFLYLTAALLIQEGDEIGSDNYRPLYGSIEGFEFENGFTQDMLVRLVPTDPLLQDSPSYEITLVDVISKTPVATNTEFKVRLTRNPGTGGFSSWVLIDQERNFSIINSLITIDCQNLCDELSTRIDNQEELTGIFIHGEGDQYILKRILNE